MKSELKCPTNLGVLAREQPSSAMLGMVSLDAYATHTYRLASYRLPAANEVHVSTTLLVVLSLARLNARREVHADAQAGLLTQGKDATWEPTDSDVENVQRCIAGSDIDPAFLAAMERGAIATLKWEQTHTATAHYIRSLLSDDELARLRDMGVQGILSELRTRRARAPLASGEV